MHGEYQYGVCGPVQFFTAMDKHALWSRCVRDDIEQFLSWGQFEMAAQALSQLEHAEKQDVVHQVMQVHAWPLEWKRVNRLILESIESHRSSLASTSGTQLMNESLISCRRGLTSTSPECLLAWLAARVFTVA